MVLMLIGEGQTMNWPVLKGNFAMNFNETTYLVKYINMFTTPKLFWMNDRSFQPCLTAAWFIEILSRRALLDYSYKRANIILDKGAEENDLIFSRTDINQELSAVAHSNKTNTIKNLKYFIHFDSKFLKVVVLCVWVYSTL